MPTVSDIVDLFTASSSRPHGSTEDSFYSQDNSMVTETTFSTQSSRRRHRKPIDVGIEEEPVPRIRRHPWKDVLQNNPKTTTGPPPFVPPTKTPSLDKDITMHSSSNDSPSTPLFQEALTSPTPVTPTDKDDTASLKCNSSYSSDEETSKNFALHDLCEEASDPDDVAWRNALELLSRDPTAAQQQADAWMPLHICCLGTPPQFLLKALLLVHPKATGTVDEGGRLPLHLAAASSADETMMQLLVDAHPQALSQCDDYGLTPLHMLLRNRDVPITVQRLRILLGQTLDKTTTHKSRRILQRRGQHLKLSLDELNATDEIPNEESLEDYPPDVQACFRKLTHWKRLETTESIELQLESSNPASIATPKGLLLPLHVLIRRAQRLEVVDDRERRAGRLETPQTNTSSSDDEEEDSSPAPAAAPLSQLLSVLIAAYPEALVTRDKQGRTPLLTALLETESLPSLETVQLLLGKRTVGYTALPEWANQLVLHPAQEDYPYSNHPAVLATWDTQQLPLHVACEEMIHNPDVLQAIYEAYPAATQVPDVRGRTPLHLALRNYQGQWPSPQVLSWLVDRVAQWPDHDGKRPFDLMVESALNIPPPDAFSERVYRQFFQASLVHGQLQDLRRLPPWLRRQACFATSVQETLLEQMARPFKTASIFLNGIVLGLVLTVFRLQLDEHATKQQPELTGWYPLAIYALASYQLVLQALFWFVCTAMSEFQHLCLFHMGCWVDFVAAVLPIVTTVLLDHAEDDTISVLGTIATGFLWLSVLRYCSSWWYGMAVLVGAASQVALSLFWPLLAGVVLVVGFAQMFLTLEQFDCMDAANNEFPVCSARDTYRIVYYLVLGTPLVELGSAQTISIGSSILVAAFILLLVLLVLTTLAIVLSTVSRLDLEETAMTWFWEPKLVVWLLCGGSSYRSESSAEDQDKSPKSTYKGVQTLTLGGRCHKTIEYFWELVTGTLCCNWKSTTETHWYTCCAGASTISLLPLRIMALIVIPIWLVLGLLTLGLLWPPQVRRWMFRSTRVSRRTANANTEYSADQISKMRTELAQLKSMSYDRSNDLQREIRDIRELLIAAMRE